MRSELMGAGEVIVLSKAMGTGYHGVIWVLLFWWHFILFFFFLFSSTCGKAA